MNFNFPCFSVILSHIPIPHLVSAQMSSRPHIPFRFCCNRGLCNRAFKNRSGLTQHIHFAHPRRSPTPQPSAQHPHVPIQSPEVHDAPAPFVYPERHNPDSYAFLTEEDEDWKAFNPYGGQDDSDSEDEHILDEEEEDWRDFNPYGGHDDIDDGIHHIHKPEPARINKHPILDGMGFSLSSFFCCCSDIIL